jgi:prophage antirepressor-like protein
MSNIILFQFESNEIRFVGTAENPEWIAADICKVLGIANVSDALESLDSDEKGIANTDDGSLTGSRMLTVTESGLYRLIFKSRKPAAKRMKKWVFSVVLPSIRKTGSYSITPEPIPQLPSRELALETAVAIDRIQDILSKSNPRLAQILIDCAMNDIVDFNRSLLSSNEFPEDKWYGLVQIASKMGIKTNLSTRVKLGQSIGKRVKELNLERVREERLCNNQYEEIWCYRDNDVVRNAIQEWADSQS